MSAINLKNFGLPIQKIHKFSASPGAQRAHEPVTRSYKSTKQHDASLYEVAIHLETQLKKSVGHSALIRCLIQLAATDSDVQQKLMERLSSKVTL